MLWGKLSRNKEQGKCSLSNRKALSISPINRTDPSSAVDTQLTLQPLDPTSVRRDKQIHSYISGAGLPQVHIAATRWALTKTALWKTAFHKSCALALGLFARLSAFFCLLAACKEFERKGIVYLRKSQIFQTLSCRGAAFLCSKLPCAHLLLKLKITFRGIEGPIRGMLTFRLCPILIPLTPVIGGFFLAQQYSHFSFLINDMNK